MAKITKATIKSFIRKNIDNIYIQVNTKFNGMTDGVEAIDNNGFYQAKDADHYAREKAADHKDYTMGIPGAWFVGQGNDRFQAYENDNFIGYEVYNCCGNFNLAIKKAS